MRTWILLLIGISIAGVTRAERVLHMTWDSCTGPLDKSPPPTGVLSLHLSVSGMNQLHKAYDVRFIYGNVSQQVPDAWRFDAAGCEGSGRILQNLAVFDKSCPPFMQTASGLQIRKVEFSPYTDPFATTLMRVLLANSYGAGVSTVDPATNYLLEQAQFDLGNAVAGTGDPPNSCGGLEEAMCFKLVWASFLDLDGTEIPFGWDYPGLTATTNDPSAAVCAAVPVRATTWGGIKGRYR